MYNPEAKRLGHLLKRLKFKVPACRPAGKGYEEKRKMTNREP